MGNPTVLIGGAPAAAIGDSHVCPLTNPGPVPHVGGPIILGAFLVLVGGKPAARQGDLAICVGPPDSVARGQPDVLIGVAGGIGLAGLLKGLALAGLAVVERLLGSGFPRAERRPDGSMVTRYTPAITIEGTPAFQAAVVERLGLIRNTASGRDLQSLIDGSGKRMRIVEFTKQNSRAGPDPLTRRGFVDGTPENQGVFDGGGTAMTDASGNPLLGSGRGTDTLVQINPNLTLSNSLDKTKPLPNDAVLLHEMIHGAHFMNATYDGSPLPGWTTQEESTTILNGQPSEAGYLEERGYPYHRTDHDLGFAPNSPST